MKLADKIVTLRKQRGLSQEQLAEKLNVSRQAVSRWEMGTALPDATNILQLSKLFEVSTDYLLNDEYNSDQDIPAVKNQKEFILLIGMQAIGFVFHIVCCFAIGSGAPVFAIVSLIINLVLTKKLSYEFDNYQFSNKNISRLYLNIYKCVIWLMALLPLYSMSRIFFIIVHALGFEATYSANESTNSGMITIVILICIIIIITAVISICFRKKKKG